MMPRLTRRNMVFLLLSLSILGFWVYTKIGSEVNLLNGTSIVSRKSGKINRIVQLQHSGDTSSNVYFRDRDGLRTKYNSSLFYNKVDAGLRRGVDTALDIIKLPHDSRESGGQDAENGVGVNSGENNDDTVSHDSIAKGDAKHVVIAGNRIHVGKGINELIRDGFIKDTDDDVEQKVNANLQPGGDIGHMNEDTATLNVVMVDKDPSEEPTTDPSIKVKYNINQPKRSHLTYTHAHVIENMLRNNSSSKKIITKATTLKIHRANTTKPVIANAPNVEYSESSEGEDSLGDISTHYFFENPQETRSQKIFMKCIMKMPSLERQQYTQWEEDYRRRELLRHDEMTYARRWIPLTQYMKSIDREQRLPDVLNIGAKKSGTTAMGWFLTMHPQISHSFGNEIHFFDKTYDKGLEYYRSRMDFAKENQLVFEKTPRYLVTDSAPAHIVKDLSPKVKFIICIRDPLFRMFSDFRHDSVLQVRRAFKKDPSIIKGRTAETEGTRFASLAFDRHGNVNSSFDSVRTSSYFKHFSNWLSYIDRDRFIIVDHQTLIGDAYHELKRIETFLGLHSYYTKDMFYFDKTRKGTCVKGKARPCPPRSSPGFLPAAKVNSTVERKLRDYFRPLNRKFVQLVGANDFTWVDL